MNQHIITDALAAWNLAPKREDYASAVDFFHATQEAAAGLEDALAFWVSTYQSGVRIVMDAERNVWFHAVDGYPARRIVNTMAFGDFGEPALIKPSPELVIAMRQRKTSLAPFLQQTPPEACKPYFWHLLTLEYEAQTVARYAANLGGRVAIMMVAGGCFLLYLGNRIRKPEELVKWKVADVPGQFGEYKRLEI